MTEGMSGFSCYGTLENHSIAQTENLLPMGLAEGCRLKCDVKKDQAITLADVEMPKERLAAAGRGECLLWVSDKFGPLGVYSYISGKRP